jgi:cellulose synthase/poly-beta-1,6-N-acetylglucosamine synthase-like glycosyltransferase
MFQFINDGLNYLTAQSGPSLLGLFWFVIIFEIPRYLLSFLAVAVLSVRSVKEHPGRRAIGRVSVVIAGHNEEDSIGRCVESLWEQSRPPDEIIVVSDGSTDRMPEKLRELQSQGLIQEAHCTQMRAGKSAAVNLAVGRTTGEYIVNVDCDCTFDRKALADIVEPFVDPSIGAVSGNIIVRNPRVSLITACQAIEYMISISQGKQAADMTDLVSCVSGAFGAFRREAILQVGGLDAGGGEDLDVTLKLRTAGWRAVFAPDAICYTDSPETLLALVRQRFRWERDAVRLRYRKHRDMLNPFSVRFSVMELLHELDFIIFNVVAAAVFPLYLIWLFVTYGALAPFILMAAQVGMWMLDGITFLLAALMTPKANAAVLLPYLPAYSPFYGLLMRFVRLCAYIQEWAFQASYHDTYVPQKVHQVRK